ncbi:hypothetical protein V8B97DRAFT_1282691 [Scleroderma yunnanense]
MVHPHPVSAATLFILHGYSQRIFSSLYAFTTVLIVCELVSSAIPQSPALLSAIFSGIVRVLCVVLFILVIRACPSDSYQDNSDIEKHGLDQLSSPHGFPARVSSPIPETWPFPASLALARPSTEHSPRNDFMAAKLLSSFPLWGATEHTNSSTKSTSPSTILILAGSQFFALLCAAVKIVMAVVVSHTTKTTLNQDVNSFVTLCHLFIAHAVFRSLWGVLLLLVIYVIPLKPLSVALVQTESPIKPPSQPTLRPFTHGIRTPKPSFSRFLSPDSASDYLSVADPFASIPPPLPPPPVVPIGLDLDEFDGRRNGTKEIKVQYRFPPPRSKARRKNKSSKSYSTSGKWSLDHKISAQSLSCVPPLLSCSESMYAGRSGDSNQDDDRSLGDEALLAQLLLQSLDQDVPVEDPSMASRREIVPIATLLKTSIPRALHIPPRSRWSSSSTVRSAKTARPTCSSIRQSRASCTKERLSSASMDKVFVDPVTPRHSVTDGYDGVHATVVSEKS